MRLLTSPTAEYVVGMISGDRVELVDRSTGEISYTSLEEFDTLLNLSEVSTYSPPVDPSVVLMLDRPPGWLQSLRDEREAFTASVKAKVKVRKKLTSGRKKKGPSKALRDKLKLLPLEVQETVLASQGFTTSDL